MKKAAHNKTGSLLAVILATLVSACSMDKMLVRASEPMIEGGITALNMETDLELAEASIPTNIELLEGMISIDPENEKLRTYAAQAYYGLSYGFNEDNRQERASSFYKRGLKHGFKLMQLIGLGNVTKMSVDELEQGLNKKDKDDVPALFWTASNWAKWIDMNRDKPESIAQLPKATALMQRVLELDSSYYHGAPHMYFGVLYGSRAPMFGGDFKKSRKHFDAARKVTNGKLLLADLLQSQYLARQQFDQQDFHDRLMKIINAPDDLYPELGLLNQIAKKKARQLLTQEKKWF